MVRVAMLFTSLGIIYHKILRYILQHDYCATIQLTFRMFCIQCAKLPKGHLMTQTSDLRPQTSDLRQQTADSRQQTADSRQQTADSRQQTADSRQQTADSRQQTADSR
jgi:hypothetical protein